MLRGMPALTDLWLTLYPPLADAWVAEPPDPWQRRIPEKLVRCLWFDARWRPTTLHTLDGRPLIVHTPGRWNVQAGPDFRQASLTIGDGGLQAGDVEIHCHVAGWTAHRHHLDPRYNAVILHVVLWQERQMPAVRRADGQEVPQVALAPWLSRPLSAYQADIVLEDYPYKTGHTPGQCYETLRRLPPQEVMAVLQRAGDARLRQRLWRWAERVQQDGLMPVLYEALLRSLGATGHRQQFQALAHLVPWPRVQEALEAYPPAARSLAAEALLLRLAGMLPDTPMSRDPDATQYLATLDSHWQRCPLDLRQLAWHGVDWRQPHVRPANTPERRLAGMAQLVAAYSGTSLLDTAIAVVRRQGEVHDTRAARRLVRALARLFDVPTQSYWTQHAYLGGHTGPAQRLIGVQRALILVVDALLPVLLLYAQRQADTALGTALLAAYQEAPLLPDNHLLRHMRQRLLGNDPALLALVQGARQQQGLLQLCADFCGNDEGHCQGCDFPALEAALVWNARP